MAHDLNHCGHCLRAFLPAIYEKRIAEARFVRVGSISAADKRARNRGGKKTQFKKSQTPKSASVHSAF
jgi:hypothetical protein